MVRVQNLSGREDFHGSRPCTTGSRRGRRPGCVLQAAFGFHSEQNGPLRSHGSGPKQQRLPAQRVCLTLFLECLPASHESRNSGNSMPELACQARSAIPGNETDQRHSALEPAGSSAGGPGAGGLRLLQLSASLLETEDHSLGHRPAGRGKASARSSAMLSKETEEVKSKPQQFLPIKKHPFFLSSVANSTETHRNAGKH